MSRPRVLWFPYSQRGSLYPVMPALEALQRSGADVLACGPLSFKAFAESHDMDFLPYRSALDYNWSKADGVDPRSQAPVRNREWFLERTRSEFDDADSALTEFQPDVVLSDSLFLGGGLAAERHGRPWVSYIHYLFDERADTDDLERHWWDRPGEDTTETFVEWWNSVRGAAGLGPEQRPREEALWFRMSPHLTVILTHPELRRRGRPLPGYVKRVQLPPWNPPREPGAAEPALDLAGHGHRVLISNSTAWQADAGLIDAAVVGLRGTGVEVVATVAAEHRKPIESCGSATVLDYFPHTDLIPLVDAVVTTAGAGVVGKALWFGKPVVAVPFGRDQHLVAEAVAESSLGRYVSSPFTPADIADAVQAVLTDSTLQARTAALSGARPEYPDADGLCRMVLDLCTEDGSS